VEQVAVVDVIEVVVEVVEHALQVDVVELLEELVETDLH
jgi:hypothetical protein